MQIPTHFKDEMEQPEFHSTQLVDIKVSIYPLLLKQENVNKYEPVTESEFEEKAIPQDYLRCPSSQFFLNRTQ